MYCVNAVFYLQFIIEWECNFFIKLFFHGFGFLNYKIFYMAYDNITSQLLFLYSETIILHYLSLHGVQYYSNEYRAWPKASLTWPRTCWCSYLLQQVFSFFFNGFVWCHDDNISFHDNGVRCLWYFINNVFIGFWFFSL